MADGRRLLVLMVCVGVEACGSKGARTPAPTQPTPTTVSPTLPAPRLDSPINVAQLATLRPTLIVSNGSSNQSGSRTYEFQISDRSDFASLSGGAAPPRASF